MAIDVLDLRDLIHKWFNAPMRRLEERCRRAQWKSLAVDVLLQLSLGYTLVVIVSIVEMALLSTFWGGERPKFAQLVHDYIHFDFLAWSPLVIPIMYIVNKFRFTYYEAARDEIGAGNERILHAIKQATDDAALRISLLKNVLLLPERARRELLSVCSRARMIGRQGDNLEATHWSNLYVAFVITMQMEPWIAVNTENAEFTFVRDIAQLRHQSGDLLEKFERQLHKDYIEMLNLVNGRLLTITYRDVSAWRKWRYYQQNAALLEREKRNNSAEGLKRLFVIENSWKAESADQADKDKLISAIIGAMWHKENGYDARFVTRDLVDRKLIADGQEFLASCLLNETVIKMYAKSLAKEDQVNIQHGQTHHDERYIYECNSDRTMTEDYSHDFIKTWSNKAAQTAEQFIDSCRSLPAYEVAFAAYEEEKTNLPSRDPVRHGS